VIRKREEYQYLAIVQRKGDPAQSKTFDRCREAEVWATTIEGERHLSVFVCRAKAKAEAATLRTLIETHMTIVKPDHKGADSERLSMAMLVKMALCDRSAPSLRSEYFAKYRDVRLAAG
jgi:hypothetical protein